MAMESQPQLAAALASARTTGDPVQIAAALDALGAATRQVGDKVSAQVFYTESLELHYTLGDRSQVINLLNILGLMAAAQHQWPQARSRLAEAATLARAWGDQPGLARSLANLGGALCDAGDLATALIFQTESLALRRALGDPRGIAHSLTNLGDSMHRAGDDHSARTYLEESLAIGRALADAWVIAGAASTLGIVAFAQSDYITARAHFIESLQLAQTLGSEWAMAEYLAGLVGVAGAAGDGERAAHLAGAARQILDAIGLELGPLLQTLYDQGVAVAQAQLSAEQFVVCWSQSQAMTRTAVIDYATKPVDSLATPKEPIPEVATTLATDASAYLQAALAIIQENSFHRATLDWPTILAQTWQRAAGAQEPGDTYAAIEFALQQLNDNHSFFWPPAKIQAIQTGSEDSRNRPPTGRLLAPGIAYLHVPDFMGSADATIRYARTLQQMIGELDATGPVGWIVDLTDNTGGNMFPMLIGLGPLFDAEEIGAFVNANSERFVWRYIADQAIPGEGIYFALDPPVVRLQHRPAPIAVLIGPATSSSGEIVAIALRGQALTRSFGQLTKGLPTANEGFALSDGAQIILTIAVSADRTGQIYSAAVIPDVMVAGPPEALYTQASLWLQSL